MLRGVAAVTLLIWMSAIVMCQTHCCGDDDHTAKEIATHHDSDSHDSDNHHDDAACATLKMALHSDNAITFAKPDFAVFTLNFVSTAQSFALTQPEVFISRQPPDDNRVFTPEVCLGPAFRSLAPPVLA